MIRTKKFENLPQITSISPSGKIVVTENGVDKVISFEDFSNLPATNDIWNNASTTFTASEVNVTDIQSAADSKLLDLKVNTVSKFTITKGGQIIGSAGSALLPTYGFFDSNWGTGYAGWYKTSDMIACSAAGGTATPFSISHIGLKIQNSIPIGWTSSTGVGTLDTILIRDGAANTLAMRNGVNAQAFRLYNTYTDATTFERLNIKWDTNVLKLGIEKGSVGGTGRSLKLESGTGFLNFDFNGPITLQGAGEVQPIYIQATGNASVHLKSSGNQPVYIDSANSSTSIIRSSGSSTSETSILGISQTGGSAINIRSKTNSVVNTELSILGASSYLTKIIFGGSNVAGGSVGTDVLIKGGLAGTNTLRCGDVYVYGMNSLGTGRSGHVILQHDSSTVTNGNVGIGIASPLSKLDIAETWNGSAIAVTGASGTGSIATITFATQSTVIPIGSTIVVASINPSGYNGTFVVTASSATSVSYANATTTTYVSGGTVQQLFTAVKLNVTDTASASNSLLMDLQVGGATKFKINKLGQLDATSGDIVVGGFFGVNRGFYVKDILSNVPVSFRISYYGSSFYGPVGIAGLDTGAPDVVWMRDAAGILAQRDGVNPQTSRLYGTYTNSSNYARLAISCDTSGNAILATEGLGTGAAGTISIGNTNKIILGTSAGVDLAFRATDSSSVGFRVGSSNTLEIVRSDAGSYANLMLNNITVQGTLSTLYAPINSNVNVAGTTGEHVALIASSSSNGTAANGFGTRIALRTESSTTAARDSGAISALWSDATDATRTSDLLFYNVLNGTLTERMRILGTNGNVGIGTTTPSVRLHIEGSANPTTLIRNTSTTGYSQIIFANTSVTNTGFWLNGSAQSDYGGLNSLNGYIGAGVFAFHTASVINAFTLLQNGNLGIGTVTPAAKLDVVSSSTSGSRFGDGTRYVTLGSNSNANWVDGNGSVPTAIAAGNNGNIFSYASNGVYFGTYLGPLFGDPGAGKAVFAGLVGIGSAPAAKLDIADTTLAGSGSLAGSILNLAQTWNTTGAPTAIKLNVTNTASGAASNLLDLQVGGVSQFKIDKSGSLTINSSSSAHASIVLGGYSLGNKPTISNGGQNGFAFLINTANQMGLNTSGNGGLTLANGIPLNWSSNSTVYMPTVDVSLIPDGAGQLALRNGVNPQTFRLYNTFTDASNYERGFIAWTSSVLSIGTEQSGTGIARNMQIVSGGRLILRAGLDQPLRLGAGGNDRWDISSSGHFIALTDNAYDIGASGATRPRDIYAGRNLTISNAVYVGNTLDVTGAFYLRTGPTLKAVIVTGATNGVIQITDSTQANFNRIQLGGTTSSFPAIKRNGAALQIRLADDSANAALETADLTVVGSASVSGHFSATTKSFLIPHPTKPDKKLQYACLEGPENGVYIRGKTNEPIILLPDYWSELVDADSITVTVTPIGKPQQLFVVSQNSTSVEIGNVDGLYNYLIFAERKDVNKLQTEI